MELGSINNTNNINGSNTAESAKNKAADDDFEKRLKNAMDNKDDKELKKVCKDFEGIILKMMYKEMRATVPKSELLPDDAGKEIFDSMLDDKLMEEASKGAGLGLSDVLFKQLSRQAKSAYNPNDDKGDVNVAGKK